jgi:hypothetical protein
VEVAAAAPIGADIPPSIGAQIFHRGGAKIFTQIGARAGAKIFADIFIFALIGGKIFISALIGASDEIFNNTFNRACCKIGASIDA